MGLPSIAPRTERTGRLVAFASGKGGVGKTVCTANLALHFAERHRILTVDLDLGCGNLNASLGVRSVSSSINDFIASRVPSLAPLKTPTAAGNLELISCSYSPLGTTVLTADQKQRLVEHLRSDSAQYVFMDLGAGANDDVLDLFAAADVRVLVTGPESLALHNAFVFVKALVYRIIAQRLHRSGLPKRTRQNIVKQLYDSGDLEIGRTIERIRASDRLSASAIRNALSGIQLQLIMNKVQDSSEERFVTNLQQLTRKYVQVELNYLGCIPYDDNVKKSLNDIVPFALEYQTSAANAAFRSVADRLSHSLSENLESEADLPQPPRRRPLAALLEDTWTATTSRLRSRSESHEQAVSDAELQQRQLEEAVRQRDEFIEKLQSTVDRQVRRILDLERGLLEKEELIRGLESQLRPAPADTTVREQVLSSLAKNPPQRITIVRMEEGGPEGEQFAAEFAAVLSEAEWVINSVSSSFNDSQFNGLKVVYDDTPQAIEGARILGHALVGAGIEYIMQRSPFPTEFERIRLVVGKNSNRLPRTLKTARASAGARPA